MPYRYWKRCFDVVLTGLISFAAIPLIAMLTLLLSLHYGGNPFFAQIRTGQYGRPFRLLKFRTMTNQCDSNGQLLPDHVRITRIGHWLRQTSLDELPQLWNILRGDMSLVGPRPLLTDYWPLYTPEQRQRHVIRPGLTGWAQVNGRNTISWDEKFALDSWYIRHMSFSLDLHIVWKTLQLILTKHDTIYMPRFTGSQSENE